MLFFIYTSGRIEYCGHVFRHRYDGDADCWGDEFARDGFDYHDMEYGTRFITDWLLFEYPLNYPQAYILVCPD